jgi:hypothetical protein
MGVKYEDLPLASKVLLDVCSMVTGFGAASLLFWWVFFV